MLLKIVMLLKGFVRVSVAGRFVERFLNLCKNRKIHIWNIKKHGEELLHLDMGIESFKRMPEVAYKSRTRVRIISRHGLPFVIQRHKKRKAFAVSAIAATALFLYITSFVWVIEVEGNEKLSAEQIVAELEKNGFRKGQFRYGNDIQSLQNKMLVDVEELSWLWVEIKGTRAIVQVKEKVPIPQIVDKDIPCNVVAERDGLITQINATCGEKAVKVGDVVKKGDLLIGGISQTAYDGLHYFHSSGEVSARTWYTCVADYPLKETKFLKTGKFFSKNTINFFGFRVKLYRDKKMPYAHSEEQAQVYSFSLGKNMVFPVSLERKICYELAAEEENHTFDSALEKALAKAYDELENQLGQGAVVVNKGYELVSESDEQITVKATCECIEDIGTCVPIETN